MRSWRVVPSRPSCALDRRRESDNYTDKAVGVGLTHEETSNASE
jgi:hypothetical protein